MYDCGKIKPILCHPVLSPDNVTEAEPRAVEMLPPSDGMDGLCKTEVGEAMGQWEGPGRGNDLRADSVSWERSAVDWHEIKR